MCKKITSHWQPLFSKKMAAASFSYKIGGGGLIFQQNWRWRQGFGNITVAKWLFWHGLDIGYILSNEALNEARLAFNLWGKEINIPILLTVVKFC